MGFPPGAAEALVLKHFNALPPKDYGREIARLQPKQQQPKQQPPPQKQPQKPPKEAPRPAPTPIAEHTPVAKTTDQGATMPAPQGSVGAAQPSPTPPPPPPPPIAAAGAAAAAAAVGGDMAGGDDGDGDGSEEGRFTGVRYAPSGKQVPVGNGGVTRRYHWTQTLYEATMYVAVPAGTRARDLDVTIAPGRLDIRLLSRGGGEAAQAAAAAEVVVAGAFPEAVKVDECCWVVETTGGAGSGGGTVVVVTLDKGARRTWWEAPIVGDPPVDCTMVIRAPA